MLVLEFIGWWYGAGWRGVTAQAGKRLQAVTEAFSIGTLLRTLVAPWRRIVTFPGAGLEAHFHAAVDNAVSRFIGLLIRLVALLAACLMLLATTVYSFLLILFWPCLPFVGLGLIVWGLI